MYQVRFRSYISYHQILHHHQRLQHYRPPQIATVVIVVDFVPKSFQKHQDQHGGLVK